MTWEGWYTLAVVAIMFVALWRNWLSTEFIVFGALIAVTIAGILPFEDALKGFSSKGMLTVAALFVVAAAVQYTGALTGIAHTVLGRPSRGAFALLRIMLPVSLLSPFLNNTPIVAIFTPIVRDWSKRMGISPSKVLIPLSYAAILGGMCTLIGTSTNLIVNGMMIARGEETLSMFELAGVGIPCVCVGILYFIFIGRHLLPDKKDIVDSLGEDSREYIVEMSVEPNCPYIGKTIESAGLRHLQGLFLAEIERENELRAPVAPTEVLREGDRLVFFGLAETIADLQTFKGLSPTEHVRNGIDTHKRGKRRLYEVVVSPRSPLVNTTIRDADFRRRYNAVVIAVHRNGERIKKKIGDISVRAGDTLLVEAREGFARVWANSSDFYLVSELSKTVRPAYEKAPQALITLIVMILLFAVWPQYVVLIAFATAFFMVLIKCLPAGRAKYTIDLSVLLVIASALGIGRALESSGVAGIAAAFIDSSIRSFGPMGALVVIYGMTTLMTEIITNNAAAALMVPIAFATAAHMNVSPRPFAIAVAIAASASFATPIGYQTNLIVYGPGGYRFSDFLKAGVPMNLLMWLVAMLTIPLWWSF